MRDIKFRAWDGKQIIEIDGNSKVVLEFNKISGWNVYPNLPNYQGKYLAGDAIGEFVLMQFTGLYDKHNNPIYEGDIVNSYNYNYEIIFAAPSFGITYKENSITHFVTYSTSWEVVGNKFEHPEILKQ